MEKANEDQVMSNRLEVLNGMITSEIMLQRAEQLGLSAVDADVEAEFNKMKTPYTKEEFEKQLAERHLTADELRAQLRRDLTVAKLINKEITSKISITDADVTNFYTANKDSFNLAEPQVHMAQILVTPDPDPNVRNLKNSKAQTEAEAQAKIRDISERLKRGEDFGMVAQNYSEDPSTAQNGGDMGFIGAVEPGEGQSGIAQAGGLAAAGRVFRSDSHAGRLPDPEGHHSGTGRPARPQRSARAAKHPRDPDEPQGPVAEIGVL